MGCRVLLLTLEKHRNGDWPHDILAEVVNMPEGLNLEQITNTVSYMARARRFDRVVALDEFDIETAAQIREHMRIRGMGLPPPRLLPRQARHAYRGDWSPASLSRRSLAFSTTTTSAQTWPRPIALAP